MSDAWVALESGADPTERIAALRSAYDAYLTAGRVERPVRPVVADSWRRSARAHVSPSWRCTPRRPPPEVCSCRRWAATRRCW
ncbi:hypothetical protein [Streptomyces sp. NPDC020681]|uniref:hypothetical protein n=1 Tax=Streptomyces sp. NPDC020681 TaxID=3365083 RepID=UPI00379AC423